GGGEVPVEREELRRLAVFGRRPRRIAEQIADGRLLGGAELCESLGYPAPPLRVEPGESLEHDRPVALLLRIRSAHPLIDEVDDADGGSARGVRVRRNDQVREYRREVPLRRAQ